MTSGYYEPLEAVLIADFGRGYSRGYMLEEVAGDFRFVAKAEQPTTIDASQQDLSAGWNAVIEELSWITGRAVGAPVAANGDGADSLLVCSTVAAATRVLIVETGSNASAPAIVEQLQRAHATLLQLVAPTGRKDGGWVSASVNAIKAYSPETVIFIGGGPADAFQRATQLFKQAGPLPKLARAIVIADGPAQDQAAMLFEGVRTRKISAAAREAGEIAVEIGREVTDLFRQRTGGADFKAITQDASGGVITRAHAVDLANRFVAASFGRRALSVTIDDGSHVHWASRDQGAMASLPELDLSRSITGLTDQEVKDAIYWLPFEMKSDELKTWVLTRATRPWTPASQARDRYIEQALARQIVRRALVEIRKARPSALADIDLVIGSAKFAEWDQPGAAALTLLDCIDQLPNDGVVDLAIDSDGLMTAVGVLATVDPKLAGSVFERDALTHLGSAVIVGGATHDGDLACRGEIRYSTGESTQFSVAAGSIELLPLRQGETAELTLRPERKFSIGGHPAGETVVFASDRRLIGGAVGVIIDARSRPLLNADKGRTAKVKQWLDAANGVRRTSMRRS